MIDHKAVIGPRLNGYPPRNPVFDAVLQASCKVYGLPTQAILRHNRTMVASSCRFHVYMILRHDYGWALARIGDAFGRHYTSVRKGLLTASDLMDVDRYFADCHRRIQRSLGLCD